MSELNGSKIRVTFKTLKQKITPMIKKNTKENILLRVLY